MEPKWFATCERVAPWAAGILLAMPVLLVRYPPMGDLPMHEALVAILRRRGDPAWAPPGLYKVVAPQSNQLFPFVALAASYVFPTDTACKLVVAATVFAAPPSAARLLARLGARSWLALLVGPVACGWMFRWGLVANLTGFVLLLLALPAADRLARRPTPRIAIACTAWALLLFFAHESAAVVFGLAISLLAALRHTKPARLLFCAVPPAAVLLLAIAQAVASRRLSGPQMLALGSYYGPMPWDRVVILPGGIFGGMSAARLTGVGGIFAGALVASLLTRPHLRAVPLRARLWRSRYGLAAVLFASLYFIFPMALGGTTLLAHRFLPAACACLVAACAHRVQSWPVAVLAMAAPVAMVVAQEKDFARSARRFSALDPIVAMIPEGSAVAQLDLTPRAPGHVAPIPPAASRVLAERGGRMLFAMTDMPPNPVYVPKALQWNEAPRRVSTSPEAFLPAFDLRRFSYLVVMEENQQLRPLLARALAPEADLVFSEGEWALFKSRLPTVLLTAPDAEPPASGDTLGARLRRMLAEQTPGR